MTHTTAASPNPIPIVLLCLYWCASTAGQHFEKSQERKRATEIKYRLHSRKVYIGVFCERCLYRIPVAFVSPKKRVGFCGEEEVFWRFLSKSKSTRFLPCLTLFLVQIAQHLTRSQSIGVCLPHMKSGDGSARYTWHMNSNYIPPNKCTHDDRVLFSHTQDGQSSLPPILCCSGMYRRRHDATITHALD